MSRIIYILIILIPLIGSCKVEDEHILIMSDLHKEALRGKVKKMKVFAYKQIQIRNETILDTSKVSYRPNPNTGEYEFWPTIDDIKFICLDTVFEILLKEIKFNDDGYKIEEIYYKS